MFSRGIYLVNLKTNERLPIMMVPKRLEVNPASNFKVLASMGRNNPFYHYTGAEKTITFEVSWYSVSETRQDVVRACKTLEAWSMADGDIDGPPDIRLVWGMMFDASIWKILSAPYQLELFNRPWKMFSTLAYQQITLAKISDTNTNHDHIRSAYS